MRGSRLIALWRRQLQAPATLKRNRDEYEFQPGYLEIVERPPAPWARGTAMLLILTIVLALAWAIFGFLDIHASASGRLMVSSYTKIIQAHEAGEVSAIHVRDGQRVKVGEVLVALNPIGVDAELSELRAQLAYKRLELAKAQALLAPDPLTGYLPPSGMDPAQSAAARAQLSSAWKEISANLDSLNTEIAINQANQRARNTEITALRKLASNVRQRLDARRAMAAQQLMPQVELLEQEKEQLDVERSLAQQHAELQVLKAQARNRQEQRDSFLARTEREQHDLIHRAQQDIAVLEQQLIRVHDKQRLQTLLAPVDGVVQQLAVHTLGGAVQPAQQLMVIVPEGAELDAEVMVLNKDVGFVKAGQPVEIKIDAFPYTRYGTLRGTVAHVSGDAIKDEQQGLVFPTRIHLEHADIVVGEGRMPLQAGMSVTGEIRTGDRRVINYLLSPIQQYQSEALRER
ncbi:HlyD family type I secretion periplasmic adaptor subunit [Pseudomonas chlororaphis subsp. aurantiaca]|uniref:HlyD family type I secretion periplasmic adaptor subunit n=1 Tax=Pseudomonas chlororaphis TaxID=587753 RepID=UPI0027DB55ED|nr:HlyD family type I secretion periplasmic adaptor subunit [Pseudomonas chlororaphis]WMI97575.1 HlyD family type I secretion periplasmic adaptor subunit [Pseudomonas chlororaphis subsp. aurantiaca]